MKIHPMIVMTPEDGRQWTMPRRRPNIGSILLSVALSIVVCMADSDEIKGRGGDFRGEDSNQVMIDGILERRHPRP